MKPYLRFGIKVKIIIKELIKSLILIASKFGRLKTSFETRMSLQRYADPSINGSNQELTLKEDSDVNILKIRGKKDLFELFESCDEDEGNVMGFHHMKGKFWINVVILIR